MEPDEAPEPSVVSDFPDPHPDSAMDAEPVPDVQPAPVSVDAEPIAPPPEAPVSVTLPTPPPSHTMGEPEKKEEDKKPSRGKKRAAEEEAEGGAPEKRQKRDRKREAEEEAEGGAPEKRQKREEEKEEPARRGKKRGKEEEDKGGEPQKRAKETPVPALPAPARPALPAPPSMEEAPKSPAPPPMPQLDPSKFTPAAPTAEQLSSVQVTDEESAFRRVLGQTMEIMARDPLNTPPDQIKAVSNIMDMFRSATDPVTKDREISAFKLANLRRLKADPNGLVTLFRVNDWLRGQSAAWKRDHKGWASIHKKLESLIGK